MKLFLLLLTVPLFAQSPSALRSGSVLPVNCDPARADIFTVTTSFSASPYFCSARNTWTQVGSTMTAGTASAIPQYTADGKGFTSGMGLVTTLANPGLDTTVPTEKAVRSAVTAAATLTPGLSLVTTLANPGLDTTVPSEKAVRTAIVAGSTDALTVNGAVVPQSAAIVGTNSSRQIISKSLAGSDVSAGNPVFNTVVGQPSTDAAALIARRNGAGQTAVMLEGQTEGNAHIWGIDKTGEFQGAGIIFNQTAAPTLANGQCTLSLSSNTTVTITCKGSDTTVRTVVLTIAP